MEAVRFGIIGAGRIARIVAGTFASTGTTPGVAVADVDEKAAQTLASQIGAQAAHGDYRRVLEDPSVDAVYVATPPYLHRPMVMEALDAGKHVICEKPFMLNVAEAADVLAAANARPELKVGSCSSRFRQADTAGRAREIVSGGSLGSVYRVGFQTVSAPPPVGSTVPAWRGDAKSNGGGILYDWGPYDIDWISFVLGELFTPRRVFATLGPYFPLTPERGCSSPDVDGRFSAEILCDDGLSIHWERRADEHSSERHSVEIRGTSGGVDTGMLPGGSAARLRHAAYRGTADLDEIELLEHDFDWGATLDFPIRDLARAVLDDRLPAAPPEQQLLLHSVMDAMVASAETATAQDISPHTQGTF